jgi:hypothetical protein
MGLSVKVDLSAYPQGEPVGIVGIGVVENGGTLEVSPENEAVFFSIYNNTLENVVAEQEEINVSGGAEFTPPEDWEAPVVEEPKSTPESTPVPVEPVFTPPTEEGDE